MTRVHVKPALLDWAAERGGLSGATRPKQFAAYQRWRRQESLPTLSQLEEFAKATHTSLGWLILSEVPKVELPIGDFRTLGNRVVAQPSQNLIDAVNACLTRQDWYREYALRSGLAEVRLIASKSVADNPEDAAGAVRQMLQITSGMSFSQLSDLLEQAGILVMLSGIVGANTHRKLDVREFRGFALSDPIAPAAFVNGADSKTAQLFSLAHELGHLLLGDSGVSGQERDPSKGDSHELWCNRFAAEVLMPAAEVRSQWANFAMPGDLPGLAAVFGVSNLTALKQLLHLKLIGWDEYRELESIELKRSGSAGGRPQPRGGNFYRTQIRRLSKSFVAAVATDAREGKTLYRDAMKLLGVTKMETFDRLAAEAGAL